MRCEICNAKLRYDEEDICDECEKAVAEALEPRDEEPVDEYMKRHGRDE